MGPTDEKTAKPKILIVDDSVSESITGLAEKAKVKADVIKKEKPPLHERKAGDVIRVPSPGQTFRLRETRFEVVKTRGMQFTAMVSKDQ